MLRRLFPRIGSCFTGRIQSLHSMLDQDTVEQKLQSVLKPDYVEVVDFSDKCGAKFDIVVVSAQFCGKQLIDRHRQVNAALADDLKNIHALTVKAYTPDQWKTATANNCAIGSREHFGCLRKS